MPSPFPGMNPYLERAASWPDFHHAYLTYLREVLAELVGPKYFVAIQERVYLHELEDRTLIGAPDVEVMSIKPTKKVPATRATATLLAPATVTIPKLRKRKVGYLEVVDSDNEKVVTVLELLSPSTKYAGEDRESYLTKRRELFATQVNLVELDFLRGGPRLPLKDLESCDYYAMVSRPAARPNADIWPIQLRDPLPTIPFPLRAGETEPLVNLQAILNRTYDGAKYGRRIYAHDPEPQLSATDAEWAKELLAAAKA
jgi:Protein of unknown function (DUF4058)